MFKKYSISFILLLSLSIANAQDLEPRALSNLPLGTNFILIGYGYAQGDILLDPTLSIQGLNTRLHTPVIGYVRSINFFGLSAKVDAVIPFVLGDWTGDFENAPEDVTLNGMGDLRLRFSFNFLNSPAMNPKEFSPYKSTKTSGFSLQIIVPTGQYNPDELLNLGSNRWVFKPQWGFAWDLDKWIVETYTSLWLFTNNNNYLSGRELKQKPLFTAKLHIIRELPKNMWVSANMGYGVGAQAYVNDIPRDSRISAARFGFHYAIPFGVKHAIKLSAVTGVRFEKGSDFDAFTITYQYRWNKSVQKYLKNKK